MSKTLARLAQEAIDVQDACNLSGVAISCAEAICELKRHVPSNRDSSYHPITYLWVNKLNDLSGQSDLGCEAINRYGEMFRVFEAIAAGLPGPAVPVPSGWDAAQIGAKP